MNYEQIREMRKGRNAYVDFEFPFLPEIKISIRVLSMAEIMTAQDLGRTKASHVLANATQDDITDFVASELLYLACYTPLPDRGQFFSSSEQVMELSRDETVLLLEHYNEVQEMYAPMLKITSEEEMEELVAEITSKSDLGMSLSSYTLRQLVQYLAASSQTLPSDNDSTLVPAREPEGSMNKQATVVESRLEKIS